MIEFELKIKKIMNHGSVQYKTKLFALYNWGQENLKFSVSFYTFLPVFFKKKVLFLGPPSKMTNSLILLFLGPPPPVN